MTAGRGFGPWWAVQVNAVRLAADLLGLVAAVAIVTGTATGLVRRRSARAAS